MNKELNVVTDWMDVPITFRTRCYECGKEILPGRAFWSESKHLRCHELESQINDKTPAMSLDNKPTNTKVMGNLNTSLDIELNVERRQDVVHVRILLPAIERLFRSYVFVKHV
jgi:hypothetical protein